MNKLNNNLKKKILLKQNPAIQIQGDAGASSVRNVSKFYFYLIPPVRKYACTQVHLYSMSIISIQYPHQVVQFSIYLPAKVPAYVVVQLSIIVNT